MILRKIFGIYPGEEKRLFRFIILAVIWAFGSSIAETLSISLFLEKVGSEHLPSIYMISSILMICSSSFFIYLLSKIPASRILFGIICAAFIFYIFATIYMASTTPIKPFWVVLQVLTSSFVVLLYACFWTFVDQYHDLQEAKRTYSLYNAFYFLGYVLSNSLIGLLIKYLGHVTFFSFISIAMFFSIMEIKAITKNIALVDNEGLEEVFMKNKKGMFSIIKVFLHSPLALTLVISSLIVKLLLSNTEFLYMSSLGRIFDPLLSTKTHVITENSLPEFLGKTRAFVSLGNIIIGTFFYRRVIRRISLVNMLFIPPFVFSFLYTGWLTWDNLILAVMGIAAVEGILYSIEDNNFNLLMNGVPSRLQGAIRMINDSFFEPLGLFLSSIFLLFLHSKSKYFGFSLCFIFVIVTFILKKTYQKSILFNLKENAIHFERKIKDWFSIFDKKEKKELKTDIFGALSSKDEEDKILALECIFSSDMDISFNSILNCINSLSSKKKSRVIALVEQYPSRHKDKLSKILIEWKEQANDHLLSNIDDNLAVILENNSISKTNRKSAFDIEKIFSFISHPDLSVKKMAAKSLITLAENYHSKYCNQILHSLQTTSDNNFRLSCLKILEKINDISCVSKLISASHLLRPNERRLIADIIFHFGKEAKTILIQCINEVSLHERSRILASKILGRISLIDLQKLLPRLITQEIEKAYFYFYYGHTIQENYPLEDLYLLKSSLLTSYQSTIDFIIHIIGAAGSIDDTDVIVLSLRSKNNKIRSEAIETIEINSDMKIFRLIRPLIHESPLEMKIANYNKLYPYAPIYNLDELLNNLESSPSSYLQTAAKHLKTGMQTKEIYKQDSSLKVNI